MAPTGLGCLLEQSIALAAADHAGALIAPDAASHPLLKEHPLVVGDARVRSFAGIAAFAEADDSGLGEAVGVICALSDEPHEFGPHAIAVLENMSVLMASLYAQGIEMYRQELTRSALEQEIEASRRLQRQFRQAERIATMGSWRMSVDGGEISWSEGVYAIHELPVGCDIVMEDAVDFFALADQPTVLANIERAIKTGESYDFEADFIGAMGTVKRVRVAGELELADGQPAALVGVVQDISNRHKLLKELEQRVSNGHLAGLPNRARLDEKLASKVRAAVKDRSPLSLVLIAVDGPEPVGDNADSTAGDEELLHRTLAILRSSGLQDNFAARLDGGELALLVRDEHHIDNLASVLERLAAKLAAPVECDGKSVTVRVSLGASILHPGGACSGIKLLENADRALNAARRDDGAHLRFAPPVSCADCAADCLQSLQEGDAEDRAA